MKCKRVGIDLAKNSFSVCAVDEHDKIVLEQTLKRKELLAFFNNLTSCMVAMEAGSGAKRRALASSVEATLFMAGTNLSGC